MPVWPPGKRQGRRHWRVFDESAWEKPESQKSEGRMSTFLPCLGQRLTHTKPGYFSPPRGPIMVPGLHWLAILLVGHTSSQDPIQLASMQWWSSRGPRAWAKRDEEARALVQVAACWGQAVLHIAGSRHGSGRVFLGLLLAYALRFVQRWPVFLAPVR